MSDNTFLEYALLYGKLGFAIVPLVPHQKYPIIDNWPEKATSDLDTIRYWWSKYPDANIGLVTGPKSEGIVVVDLDEHPEQGKYGLEIWEDYQREHGRFPETLEAQTGGGGRHIFYRCACNIVRSQHLYNSSVDFQSDGALIVLPPSIHPNGRQYFWDEFEPDEIEIATIPQSLFPFLREGRPDAMSDSAGTQERPENDLIYEGCRVNTMFKLTAKLKGLGLSDEAIKDAVRQENTSRCVPPLTERELEKEVFPSISRYEDNTSYYKSFQIPDTLFGRQRNSILYRAVCSMKSKGWSDEAIRNAVVTENALKCSPPLTPEQLEKTVFPALTKFKGGGMIERRRQVIRLSEISQI